MEPSELRSDRSILWTVTSLHGSDGCLVSAFKRRRSSLFFPPYTASFHLFFFNPLSKITLSLTLKPSLNHSQSSSSLPLSKITLNPHTLKSQSLSRCCLSPSRRRTVAARPLSLSRLFVTLSLLPLSRVAVAAQPRLQLPRRRRSSAQVFYLWYYQYQRFRVAVNTFSLFFFGIFFFWVWTFGNFCVWLCHLLI